MIVAETMLASVFASALSKEQQVRSRTAGSLQRWQRASQSLAGGVSSGLRRSARPYPLYFQSGHGPRLTDVDGNQYLDYTLGWGPNMLGNSPDCVVEAIREAAGNGLTFGAQHDLEYQVAELLQQAIPCADRVCFANSGTEIVQVALRLARAATGRRCFIKFEGHYHGWEDSVLLSYHPSAAQIEGAGGKPVHEGSGQVPADYTLVARWNDRQSVEAIFDAYPDQICAIICEPLMCNSGCIAAEPGFLQFLRDITSRQGALLIFDEVICGFRLALGGAQELYGVVPDLATYAKAVGAGTPLSVLAGKAPYMQLIEEGRVIHAGTLNGNPLALAAARAALQYLTDNAAELYPALNARGLRLREGIAERLRATGLPVCAAGVGSVFHLCFTHQQPMNYRDLLQADKQSYSDFLIALLAEGVMPLPDGRWYLSTAHTDADVDETLAAVSRALQC